MLNFLSGRKFRELNAVIKEILVYDRLKNLIFAAIIRVRISFKYQSF